MSDVEAEKIFLQYKKHSDPKHQLVVLDLLRFKGFACRYFDDLVKYFSMADTAILQYMKMQEDANDDLSQNRIMKKIRTSAQKKKKEVAKTA